MRKPIISDEELITQYLNGNENCLQMLINRHKQKIYSTIYMLVKDEALAEDIFQDTFFKIVDTLKRGKYNEEGKFLQWSVRIARNLVIDYYRKTSKMPMVSSAEGTDLFQLIQVVEPNREEEMMEEQTHLTLRRLIQELPEEQRQVLILRHYAQLSFKEIAELTQVSINTALGRMRYALGNLRKLIEKNHISL
jgi:RNA polymerase sigma-70 factor (ECF subfamily)